MGNDSPNEAQAGPPRRLIEAVHGLEARLDALEHEHDADVVAEALSDPVNALSAAATEEGA